MFYPSQDYAPIGSLKARYRPLGLVAQGQFGKVYCAIHRKSGRLVALKLLDRQRSSTSQFLRELSSLLNLQHPALTQLRAIEQTDAGRCLVLDYCAGGTLRHLLESPALPQRRLLLDCLVQVLEGLAHAHGRGIVHCDVKPENILMQLLPGGWRACLTDFGIAQSSVTGVAPEFERGGSPAYMAPERFAGEAYVASDLYSMGIILHEVLLGDRPFHGSPNALREAHRQQSLKLPLSLAIPFQSLLYKSLAKAPDFRYGDAGSMAQDLREAIQSCLGDEARQQEQGSGFRPPVTPISMFQPLPETELLPWPLKDEQAMLWEWPEEPLMPGESRGTVAAEGNFSGEAIAPCAATSLALLLGNSATPGSSVHAPTPQLWLAQGRKLQGGLLAEGGLAVHQATASLTLPEIVTQLTLGDRHGFATTARGLYRWPLPGPGPTAEGEQSASEGWTCLLNRGGLDPCNSFTQFAQFSLSPQGHWGAILRRSLPQASSSSTATDFFAPEDSAAPPDSLLLMDLSRKTVPFCRELPLDGPAALVETTILDRRHGVAILTGDGPGEQKLALFSRRGHWLNRFSLPVSLAYSVRGLNAYELWAIEAGHPQVLLRIGLKPFRLQRLPLAIAPDQIHPLPWGCVLANQAGQILLLNQEGQSLGQLQVPLPEQFQNLWLAPVALHGLAIALQQAEGMKLWFLDLRCLELLLVF